MAAAPKALPTRRHRHTLRPNLQVRGSGHDNKTLSGGGPNTSTTLTASATVTAMPSPPTTTYTIDVGVHPEVESLAVKHAYQLPRFLEHHPISAHTREAYAHAVEFVRAFHLSRQDAARNGGAAGPSRSQNAAGRKDDENLYSEQRPSLPIVLDSGCGTGRSAALLAKSYPHLPVLGVDRSAVRLSKGRGRTSIAQKMVEGSSRHREALHHRETELGGDEIDGCDSIYKETERVVPTKDDSVRGGRRREEPPPNLLLLRADLVDLWILASRDNEWVLEEHAILYPNPYPKRSQLRSRWHGHPVFPVLLGLGGKITLRSNWKSYLDEVCQAVLAIADEAQKEMNQENTRTKIDGEVVVSCGEGRTLGKISGDGDAGEAGEPGASFGVVSAACVFSETGEREGNMGAAEGGNGNMVETGGPDTEGANKATVRDGEGQYVGMAFSESKEGATYEADGSSRNSLDEVETPDSSFVEIIPVRVAAAAAAYRASASAGPSRFVPVEPMTNFEAKYKAVGETVYELRLEPWPV